MSQQIQVIEGTLSERALRAESMAETADHKRITLEEQASEFKQQSGLLTTRLNEAQAALQVSIFHYLYVDCLMPLAGLHFCVGLDFVTPSRCILF
jgi:hypothetical protein